MRNCPKCRTRTVVEDGYCGRCRECTMQPLSVKRGTDSQQRRVGQHRGFWMETPEGHDAHILGDRKMPARTREALGAMIDAAVKAAEAGKLEVLSNEKGQPPCAEKSKP